MYFHNYVVCYFVDALVRERNRVAGLVKDLK
jgi:hypothetical protein